jgi:sec-independent protein translocase protein TatB
MFGVGWTEMLLIGIVALVVIGPKDLPLVMNRLGKAIGTIRRMGNEFQRELNKTTGLDQITDLRRTLTEPLKQTAAEITREFNKPLPNGAVEPSGAIAPKTPGAESVADEILEKVGMSGAGAGPAALTPLMTGLTPSVSTTPVESPAPAEAIAPGTKRVRKPRAKKAAPAAAPLLDAAPEPVAETPKPKTQRKRTPKPKAEA